MPTVLVADDDIHRPEAWTEWFELHKMPCRIAPTWDEALKLLAQYRPDCLLLEVHWSDEEGRLVERFDFVRESKERFPDTKIFTMCGCCPASEEESHRAKSKELGAEDFFPTKGPEMIEKVIEALKIHPAP